MLRNFFVTILAVIICNTAVADENSLLVQKYLNSFASRDAAGIFQLINWEGVDKQSRQSLQKYIKSGFKGRQIRRIYIEPVAEGADPSYVQDGKTYQLNLKPTGQLNIVYISNKGKRSSTQLFVGQHNGELMIGSAVVAPESLACGNPESKKKSC
ncbi:hypothetical protein [Neptuniibacter sp.]|uniref:hypothetical protein n=1 Tax=Neptuniibacter sp. TaxID=1962643 RepID=UPI00260EC1F5|nr:hypothetical protein [Neptuniibacter sp.]MCP4598289.1 hypothetical protein [Neptuniibacter sp.]